METPRPLTSTQRENLATWLQALAEELGRAQARETQQAIGIAATDRPYPSRASTSPPEPSHQTDDDGKPIRPDTPVEAAAINTDPATNDAMQLLRNQRALDKLVRQVLRDLWLWRPDRNVPRCPLCEHPYQRGENRCRQIINGHPCTSPKARARVCANGCEIPPGGAVRNGLCNKCDIAERKKKKSEASTAVASVERIHIQDNVMVDDAPQSR